MVQHSTHSPSADSGESLIPQQAVPEGAHDFSRSMDSLLDGQPKEESVVAEALAGHTEMLDLIAAGMYNLASMLVGEGEPGVRLVEIAMATAEIPMGERPEARRRAARRALVAAALDLLMERDAHCLAVPTDLAHATTCIEDDELDAASDTGKELATMLAGPDRESVRNWMAGLPPVLRVVFVARAVAGLPPAEVAALLATHGGPEAAGWTGDAVREIFRQGLCSLASQLIQTTLG